MVISLGVDLRYDFKYIFQHIIGSIYEYFSILLECCPKY